MTEALVNPSMLRWARERFQLSPDILAQKLNVASERISLWEQGEARPTFRQAQTLARVLRIPFGYLYLDEPPLDVVLIPDLRTLGSKANSALSIDLIDLLSSVLRRHDWYKERMVELGAESIPFVGRFTTSDDPLEIATDMVKTLGIADSDRQSAGNWESFLNMLMERAEDARIWVMRSGIVGTNTRRPLNVSEFRGFAISDDIAPLVFVNGQDARAAQIFTLVHELAHIWIGQTGISNVSLTQQHEAGYEQTEALCNAVAAEVLVPRRRFCELWAADESLPENADRLARIFRVSSVVIARRALDLGYIEWSAYSHFYQEQSIQWDAIKESSASGGSYYRTQPVRNGKSFTETVVHDALERKILLRDAGRLLDVNPAKIDRLAREIGIL